MKHTKPYGFTLIELMITIIILSILALIAYPSYSTFVERARMDNARATMLDVIKFMEQQYAQKRTFCAAPNTTSGATSGSGATSSATCGKPNISAIIENSKKYTVAFQEVTPSSYVLVATPVNNGSSDSKFLNILYDSKTTTFARCNSTGFDKAKKFESTKTNEDLGNNCEVF